MIKVAPDAQKTDAKMACNTLLMSDDADFSVKPELEIFADDVICGHGATVSDIDRNHLFYLMARGVPENKARACWSMPSSPKSSRNWKTKSWWRRSKS